MTIKKTDSPAGLRFLPIVALALMGTLLFTIPGCSRDLNFPVISNEMYLRQGRVKDKTPVTVELLKLKARTKVYKTSQAEFLKKEMDTLFLLESYDPQYASVNATITDRKNRISYKYVKNKLILLERSAFTDYEIKLVLKWDTLEIRKESKLNGNLLGGTIVNASRCYRKDGNWVIENIYFSDFFDLKRDQ
ncbi:hypothetical protein [Pedobacter caeni]|uniref:Uncharacterized protein n=1 Tax=Pedobacter caeni TaxID=288992 RepID=A0A1M4W6I7_9SPHI|nr:hypothetical protein [Pedobacter caeni]SHE76836.1 hypothetical protein SAMN04488522_1011153 [Pedobacter caeni]